MSLSDPSLILAGGRRADSRRRLLTAARDSFVTQGYHATRPQDIARAAGVGHGTFYLHFADKQACFLAFVQEATAELNERLAAATAGVTGLEAHIRAILTAIQTYGEDNPGVLGAALTDLKVIAAESAPEERVVDRWARQWADLLRPARERGEIADDCDLDLIGYAIVGALVEAGGHIWTRGEASAARRRQLLDQLARFLVRGLGPVIR